MEVVTTQFLPVAPDAGTVHKRADSAARFDDDSQSPGLFANIRTEAVIVTEPKADFELQDIILDEVRPDEVLIEMKYSGICHTDIVLQQGLLPMVDFPAIFGHEGAGIIRGIGSAVKNKDLRIGDAALLSSNTCDDCKPCNSGHPAYCEIHAEVNQNAVRISDRSTPARLERLFGVNSLGNPHSPRCLSSTRSASCLVLRWTTYISTLPSVANFRLVQVQS